MITSKKKSALAKFLVSLCKMKMPKLGVSIRWLPKNSEKLGYTYRRKNTACIYLNGNQKGEFSPLFDGLDDNQAIFLITGVAVHEFMHQILTNFVLYGKMLDTYTDSKAKNLFKKVFNIFEDSRIESYAPSYFAGETILALNFSIRRMWEASPNNNPEDNIISQVIAAMVQYGDIGVIKPELSEEAKELFNKINPLFNEAIDAKSCAICLSKAKQATSILLPYIEDVPEEDYSSDDSSDCDSEGEDAEDSDASRSSRSKKIGKSPFEDLMSSETGTESDDASFAADSKDEKSGGTSDDSPDEESSCGKSDKSDEAEKKSDETDGSDKSRGSSDDAEKPEDESEDKADEKGSGSASEEDEDSDKTSEETGSEEKSEDGSDGAGKDSGEKSDDESFGESAKGESGKGDIAPEKGESQYLDGCRSEECTSFEEDPEEVENDSEASPEDFEKAMKELEKTLEALEKSEEEAEKGAESDYDFGSAEYPTTDKYVRVVSHHKATPNPEVYEKYLKIVESDAHELAKLIKRQFKTKPGRVKRADHGDLNLMRYKDPNFRSPLIFDKKKPREKHCAAVMLLVDESGSMAGRGRITNARLAAIMLAEAMAEAGIPCSVVGHSGDDKYNYSVELEHYTTFKNAPADRTSLAMIEARCQNRDGPAIRWASSILKKRPERNKLMIVISDGQPAADSYYGEEAIFDTKAAIRDAKRLHNIVGVILEAGSSTDILKTMYGNDYVECASSKNLKESISKIITSQCKNW